MAVNYNKSGVFVRNNTIYVQGNVDGIFYRKSTKKEATKANLLWAKKNAQNVLLQLINKHTNDSDELISDFGYRSLHINESNRRPMTNKEYKATFEKHILPRFGKWTVKQIRPTDLKAWQNDLAQTLSAKRIISIRTVFRGILQDAFIDEIIPNNPFDRVKPPKALKTDIKPFSLDEVERLINASQGWFKNYLILAFFTGMRVGEIMALQWQDIDLSKSTIRVCRSIRKREITLPKTVGSIREIDLLPHVTDALMHQMALTGKKSSFVFVNQYGDNFHDSVNLIKRHWKPLLNDLKIDYRILYQTRHTFASIMLQQGEEAGWVSSMMGHVDLHTTLTKYARYIPRENKIRAKFLNNVNFSRERTAQNLHIVKKV